MTDQVPASGSLPFYRRLGKRHFLVLLALLILAGAGAGYYFREGAGQAAEARGNGKNGRPGGPNRPQPVSVMPVAVKDVPLWLTAIGSAVPRNLVTLRTRVDGELLRLHFAEGQMVKQGQLLAEIDPRPFQAQLAQANGQLARDNAFLQNARVDLARYQDLWAKDSIARQQLDTQEALVRQYEGTVENDRGLVDNAKLQLGYTRIVAPVSGRIGLRQVDPGNQVHASDANGLASIAQVEPMMVVFAVPEGHLPEINRRLAAGDTLEAEAWDRELKNRLAAGKLLTTDNQIDPATGTIKLKAQFANAERSLFPNQFVNVRLLLGTRQGATVVPGAAVQRGARGAFVYAVDAEGGVKSLPVTPGPVDGELMAVDGLLKPGDRVVTDGADKLRDGAKVEVISPEKRQAQAAPGGDQKPGGRGRRQQPDGAGR
ncbi:MAG: multidrug transporter subunit MdtA [Rhodocyclaceae bacterium]|nr:multidrug transporter subunit MdtA [Rhodocyclaceae bacterium]